jgi:hypothetical protein
VYRIAIVRNGVRAVLNGIAGAQFLESNTKESSDDSFQRVGSKRRIGGKSGVIPVK